MIHIKTLVMRCDVKGDLKCLSDVYTLDVPKSGVQSKETHPLEWDFEQVI